jgi:hypothetical protein
LNCIPRKALSRTGGFRVYTWRIMSATRVRRLGGWGFEGESYPPSPQLLEWLERHVGPAEHPMSGAPSETLEGPLKPHVLLDPNDRLEV